MVWSTDLVGFDVAIHVGRQYHEETSDDMEDKRNVK